MPEDAFEIDAKDAAGRIGTLHTRRGPVTTPALLPVVHPRQQTIQPALLDELGIEIVIANSYAMRSSDTTRERVLEQGVHDLLGFDGVVMTDSGTFQAHVYGDVDVTNEEIVAFQAEIGSDIATILDVFSEPDDDETTAREGLETTTARAEAAIDLLHGDETGTKTGAGTGATTGAETGASAPESEGSTGGGDVPATGGDGDLPVRGDEPPGLALPVQGGVHDELRREAGRRMDALDGTVYPIGGVVPLMEQERFLELARVVAAAKTGLSPHRCVHLFGCGHPRLLPLAVALGCDLFDSASYAKYADDGRYMAPDGTYHLQRMSGSELPCPCPVCVGSTPDELLETARDEPSPLAEHNLRVLVAELHRTRAAIRDGRLLDHALRRARTHPRLLDAVRVLADDRERLLALDPATKRSSVTWTGPETADRPEIERYRRRLATRLRPALESVDDPVCVEVPWTAALAEGRHGPWADPERGLDETMLDELTAAGAIVVAQSPLGPVPWLLAHHFPVGQSVLPREVDPTRTEEMVHATRTLLDRLDPAKRTVWRGADAAEGILESARASDGPWSAWFDDAAVRALDPDDRVGLARVAATATMQLGAGAAEALLGDEPGAVDVHRSSSTGRIRTVDVDGDHVASLRARDGHLTLKPAGARRLHAGLAPPRLRVPVVEDSVAFNREGRSVFAGFVASGTKLFDPDLPAACECLVVDGEDRLVAVGQTRLSAREMAAFERGVAVRVRDGIEQG